MIPSKTVAVVDDREDNLDAIQSILYLANYRVFACQSVCAFEQGLMNLRPDLLIIDIHLGSEDGRLLCSKLKQQPRLAHVPVLLLSARPGFIEAELKQYGADAFLEKPFDMDRLLALVADLTNTRH